MFGWKQDLFVMSFYSKLEVLGGEISPCFVPKNNCILYKKNYEKNSPKLTIFQEKKKLKSP